jgi:hypothetical protein
MHTRNLALVLRILAFVVFLVGALHLALGVRADVLLGARAPAAAITDPTLDSQGRFHGVSFAVYGVLLLLGASDVRRYAVALRWALWVIFAAGLARLVSVAIYGFPPPPVVVLLVVELVVPPALIWWLSRVVNVSKTDYAGGY